MKSVRDRCREIDREKIGTETEREEERDRRNREGQRERKRERKGNEEVVAQK